MDLKEIGIKLVWMIIKWFLEEPTRISVLGIMVLHLLMYVFAYPLAYIADKKLEAEEEWKKNEYNDIGCDECEVTKSHTKTESE